MTLQGKKARCIVMLPSFYVRVPQLVPHGFHRSACERRQGLHSSKHAQPQQMRLSTEVPSLDGGGSVSTSVDATAVKSMTARFAALK